MLPIFDFSIGHHILDLLFFFIYGARYSRRELYFVYVIVSTYLRFVLLVCLWEKASVGGLCVKLRPYVLRFGAEAQALTTSAPQIPRSSEPQHLRASEPWGLKLEAFNLVPEASSFRLARGNAGQNVGVESWGFMLQPF